MHLVLSGDLGREHEVSTLRYTSRVLARKVGGGRRSENVGLHTEACWLSVYPIEPTYLLTLYHSTTPIHTFSQWAQETQSRRRTPNMSLPRMRHPLHMQLVISAIATYTMYMR